MRRRTIEAHLSEADADRDPGAWITDGSFMTHRLEADTPCPSCQARLDGATGGTKKPTPGSVTVCSYCLTRLVFDEHLQLKTLSSEELASLPDNVQDALSEIRSLVMAARLA